jgi:hypothetical protein
VAVVTCLPVVLTRLPATGKYARLPCVCREKSSPRTLHVKALVPPRSENDAVPGIDATERAKKENFQKS